MAGHDKIIMGQNKVYAQGNDTRRVDGDSARRGSDSVRCGFHPNFENSGCTCVCKCAHHLARARPRRNIAQLAESASVATQATPRACDCVQHLTTTGQCAPTEGAMSSCYL